MASEISRIGALSLIAGFFTVFVLTIVHCIFVIPCNKFRSIGELGSNLCLALDAKSTAKLLVKTNDQKQEKDTKKKSSKKKKSTTSELAAKERKAEREELKNALRAVESEHRERLQRLRETLRKRKEENAPSKRQKTGNEKKIAWKDGMKTQTNRNRRLLEEVFVFTKELPASRRGMATEDDDIEMLDPDEEPTETTEAADENLDSLDDDEPMDPVGLL